MRKEKIWIFDTGRAYIKACLDKTTDEIKKRELKRVLKEYDKPKNKGSMVITISEKELEKARKRR